MMNQLRLKLWMHFYYKMDMRMILMMRDCIMRFIFRMREKLLQKNGRRLLDIRLRKNKIEI